VLTVRKPIGTANGLRSLREAQGLQQADVASTLHITPSAISHFERGKRRVTLERAADFARIYQCTIQDIFYAVKGDAASTQG
jgi:DNA-binding XRE family transcriptional regulator